MTGYAGALGRGDLVEMVCGDIAKHPHDGLGFAFDGPTVPMQFGFRSPSRTPPARPAQPSAGRRWWPPSTAAHAPAVIRLIKADDPFTDHICDAPLPRTRARAALFRSIRKNGNLSPTPLSGASIHLAVRRRARLAGYDDEFVGRLGVQSLRVGFITQALRNGADAQSVLRQTGHIGAAALQRYAPGGASRPQRRHRSGLMTLPAMGIQLDRTASHTWALFVDWCSATGHVALPAQPETLAEFLADHPAQLGTHRRRVTAINSTHRQRGFVRARSRPRGPRRTGDPPSRTVAGRHRHPRRGDPAAPSEWVAARPLRAP